MNPPHSTVSPSPASSIHTKEYAPSSSTHTSYTARAHSNKSIRSAIDLISPLESEATIIPPSHSPSRRSKTASHGTPTKTRTRRRKSHHKLHRNFSRTTSTPSVDTYTTTTLSSSLVTTETRSSTTRSPSRPPPYSRHPPSVSTRTRARIPKRLQPPGIAKTLATLDDIGAYLFFRLPLYLGGRKTVYLLDDLGIWGFLRPARRLGALYERVEERWSFWRDWR